jgi:hypothetical protein
MSSCSDSEFMVSDVVTATTDTAEYYVIDYPIFIACLWVPIIVLFMCAVHWTNRQMNQLKSDICDQQEKCEAYSQANINKYNYILSKMEEDNASLREYVLVLETRLARLQSIAPTESTMIRIRDDANANYANLGQRIISIRTQCINALNELDNKYQLKCDDLTANASNLTRRLDVHLENYSLTDRYVQEDDAYKQVLIGYRRFNTPSGRYEDPIFCPRYTTDFDKYLGHQSFLLLDGLAQLPVHKPFIFADYYLHCGAWGSNIVSAFVDRDWNVISSAGYNPGNITTDQAINEMCNNDFKKVQEYCEKIGVKCLTK